VWVQSLLNFATIELELLTKNPWRGINLKYSTTETRRPWTEDELRILFSSEVFTQGKAPKDWRAGGEAAFWLPILGLYTGARISELTQLRSCDIKSESDISYIQITNNGINQKLKTAASNRKIPVHSQIIKLGFMEYVQRIKLENRDSLWPKLPMRTNKAGGYFSNWFGEYRGRIGLAGYPDFHCLRHTVRTKLLEADIKEQLIDMIMGHKIQGSTGAKFYSHRTLATLRDAIEKLTYVSPKELLTVNLHQFES
jgi:integrase